MDETTRKQVLHFKSARTNLLTMALFTAGNLILAALNTNLFLLFSATTPQFVFELGRFIAAMVESRIPFILGLVVSFCIIGLFGVCWGFSKRHRVFLPIALVLFSLDSLFLVYFIVTSGFEGSSLPEIAFHVWVLYYLIRGTLAWANLRGVPAEDFARALAPAAQQ